MVQRFFDRVEKINADTIRSYSTFDSKYKITQDKIKTIRIFYKMKNKWLTVSEQNYSRIEKLFV